MKRPDKWDKKAKQKLPCMYVISGACRKNGEHLIDCPAHHRRTIAAALRRTDATAEKRGRDEVLAELQAERDKFCAGFEPDAEQALPILTASVGTLLQAERAATFKEWADGADSNLSAVVQRETAKLREEIANLKMLLGQAHTMLDKKDGIA